MVIKAVIFDMGGVLLDAVNYKYLIQRRAS